MEDDTDDLETGYIKHAELLAAKRQGPDKLWDLLEKSLRTAEAESNPFGIHEVLHEMLHAAYTDENPDRQKRVAEIAERYADLEHDNPQRIRYIGADVYKHLHTAPLAIRYMENARRQAIANLRSRGISMLGFGIHDLLETMRAELYTHLTQPSIKSLLRTACMTVQYLHGQTTTRPLFRLPH